jgi:hypothetical protein
MFMNIWSVWLKAEEKQISMELEEGEALPFLSAAGERRVAVLLWCSFLFESKKSYKTVRLLYFFESKMKEIRVTIIVFRQIESDFAMRLPEWD